MIYNLRGKLTACDINFIVVECGGVGFKCFTSLNTAKQLSGYFSLIYDATARAGLIWPAVPPVANNIFIFDTYTFC